MQRITGEKGPGSSPFKSVQKESRVLGESKDAQEKRGRKQTPMKFKKSYPGKKSSRWESCEGHKKTAKQNLLLLVQGVSPVTSGGEVNGLVIGIKDRLNAKGVQNQKETVLTLDKNTFKLRKGTVRHMGKYRGGGKAGGRGGVQGTKKNAFLATGC